MGTTDGKGDGVGDSAKQITDGITDIGKRIALAFTRAIDPVVINNAIEEVDKGASELIVKFGQGRDQILNLKASMTDAVVEVTRLGGGFDEILRIQKSVSDTLGRNLVISSEAYKDLYAAQKVMGPMADSLVKDLKDVGISLYQSSGQIQKIMDRSREIGVSAEKVGGQVSQNLSLMNTYTFQGGVDGLAKMAAQAVNMRININDISNTMTKAFNPESAIEMAASLQRLGVAQSDLLDPLRLMDLAQNDPAELQNQIVQMSKQFATLNAAGQFEIMPGAKRQMAEVEQALGMTGGSLAKMALSSAELGDKMSKIRFAGDFTEEEKTMFANMAEMGEGGEYKVSMTTAKGKETLSMEDAMAEIERMGKEERAQFFESQKPKDISKLAEDQLSVSESMLASLMSIERKFAYPVASSKANYKIQREFKKGYKGIGDTFDNDMMKPNKIRTELDKLTDGLEETFTDGKFNFDKMTKTMNDFALYVDGSFKETWKVAQGQISNVFGIKTGNPADMVTTDDKKPEPQSTHVVEGVHDMIKMPGKTVKTLPQDSIFAMTKGPEFLEKLSMLNQPMNSSTNGTVNENKNTHDITLTIKIDGGNISESKVMEILNKTETLQALNKKLKETVTNNGLSV